MADVMHQGSCLCGGVCFILHGEPEKVFICYCTDCQKNAGGPGQICANVPKTSLEILEGESLLGMYVIKETISGHEKHKVFCKQCSCTLWTIPLSHGGEKYIVRTSLIEGGLSNFEPSAEVFASKRPKYMDPIKGAQSFATMPGR